MGHRGKEWPALINLVVLFLFNLFTLAMSIHVVVYNKATMVEETCDELTTWRLSADQSMQSTLPWCPFRTRRGFIVNVDKLSNRCATIATTHTHLADHCTSYMPLTTFLQFKLITQYILSELGIVHNTVLLHKLQQHCIILFPVTCSPKVTGVIRDSDVNFFYHRWAILLHIMPPSRLHTTLPLGCHTAHMVSVA